ncbi:MAG: Type 1 glutamine amidotransferase-like domain-containing protein [bacterium]
MIKPVYLLAGGAFHRRQSHDPLIHQMLRETARPQPTVAYIGTASGDDPHFFNALKTLLEQNGAGRVDLVPLASPHCKLPAARSLLASADLIFFSGGDVELGMRLLRERGVVELISDQFRAGTVLAGISAGSILLCQQWLHWPDPDDDSTVEPFDCLGIVPLICDMHDEAGGWTELKTLLSLRQIDGEIGYGIPASAGLRIHPDHRIEEIGGRAHQFIFRNGRVTPCDAYA